MCNVSTRTLLLRKGDPPKAAGQFVARNAAQIWKKNETQSFCIPCLSSSSPGNSSERKKPVLLFGVFLSLAVPCPAAMNSPAFVSSFAGTALRAPGVSLAVSSRPARVAPVTMGAGQLREIRDRITSVKNTQKITDAMRLVAAAKVRRAQDAVLRTRPFSAVLQKVLGGLIKRLNSDFTDLPLLAARETKKVVLVVVTGDRGLCGGYNGYIIKKTSERIAELSASGIAVELVTVGNKGQKFFKNRDVIKRRHFECTQAPTADQATSISDELLAEYLSGEVDRIELIYTKFVSLIASEASLRTILPLSPQGIEVEGDEIFQLTSVEGELYIKKETIAVAEAENFPSDMIFEQDPLQILNAILPLYLNGQILRALQEAVASELAARMSAMSSASDNAKELGKNLSLTYNRGRQAAITQEISEICAGQML